MEQLLQSIEKSVSDKNWLSALFMAICLPDICASIEDKVMGNGARYRDWFNRYPKKLYNAENLLQYMEETRTPENLSRSTPSQIDFYRNKESFAHFTAEQCWALRNACLHQGKDEARLKKFVITFPDHRGYSHLCEFNGVMQLDAAALSLDLVKYVRIWMKDVENDSVIQQKLNSMINVRDYQLDFWSEGK